MKKKIAILGLFGTFDPGYALAVGWTERAKMLKYFDQDFTFFVNEGNTAPEFIEALPVVPRVSDKGPFEERVKVFTKFMLDHLQGYDCILTADLIYQQKGNFLPMNQAMRNAAPHLKAHWYHWIHSGHNAFKKVEYPNSLRYTMMQNSTLVYMNECEKMGLQKMYGASSDKIACVYNPKDYRSFNDFHSLSWQITKQLNIMEKDFVQVFPVCSTRMETKGIDDVIFAFSRLKKAGHKVALVIANSHIHAADKKANINVLAAKDKTFTNLGLIKGEDYLWTSELLNGAAAPRKVIADLMNVSNIFIFGSWREVCPNILLEAKIAGCQLVINENNKPLVEFADEHAIRYIGTFKVAGAHDTDNKSFIRANHDIPKRDYYNQAIVRPLEKLLPYISRKYQWEFSYERIWKMQLEPLLYGEQEMKVAI